MLPCSPQLQPLPPGVELGAYSGIAYGLDTPLPPPPPLPPLYVSKRIAPNLTSTEQPPMKKRLGPLSRSDTQPSDSSITSSWSPLKSCAMTPTRLQSITTRMQVLQETLRELLDIAALCMEPHGQNNNSQQEQRSSPSHSTLSPSQTSAIDGYKDVLDITQKETTDLKLMSPQENERDHVVKVALLEAERCKAELSELHAELTLQNLRHIIKKSEKDGRQQVADSERKGLKKKNTNRKQMRQDTTEDQWAQLRSEASWNRNGRMSNSQDRKERKHTHGADKMKRSKKEDPGVNTEENETDMQIKESENLKNRRLEREGGVLLGKDMGTADGNHEKKARSKIMIENNECVDRGKQVDRGPLPVSEIKTEPVAGSGSQRKTVKGEAKGRGKVKSKNNENMSELGHDSGNDVVSQSKTKDLMKVLQDRIDKSIGIVNMMFEQKTSGRHIKMESCPKDETQRLNKILAAAYADEFVKLIRKAKKMIKVLNKYEREMPQKDRATLLQPKNGTKAVPMELKDVQPHCNQFVSAIVATEEAALAENLIAPVEPSSNLWAACLTL